MTSDVKHQSQNPYKIDVIHLWNWKPQSVYLFGNSNGNGIMPMVLSQSVLGMDPELFRDLAVVS